MSALEVRGVVKRLNGPPAPVLDGIDLLVEPGGIVGVVGANGAGKTTLLRVVAGLLRPDAGRVSLGRLGPERDARAYHRRVAMLSADGGLYARLTVQRHLEWWAAMCFVPRGDRPGVVARALAEFGLESLSARRAERLSAGQRQRVRLAMVFLPDPAVVLLDEPDARLDEHALALISDRLGHHTERGGIAVWAAPEGREAPLPADRVAVLREGRLA